MWRKRAYVMTQINVRDVTAPLCKKAPLLYKLSQTVKYASAFIILIIRNHYDEGWRSHVDKLEINERYYSNKWTSDDPFNRLNLTDEFVL